jgi:hypothetical protein
MILFADADGPLLTPAGCEWATPAGCEAGRRVARGPTPSPGRRDTVVLPADLTEMSVLTVPRGSRAQTNELLAYHLERLFPDGGARALHDHVVLERRRNETVVLLVAIQRSDLERVRRSAGLARLIAPLQLAPDYSMPTLIVGPRWVVSFRPNEESGRAVCRRHRTGNGTVFPADVLREGSVRVVAPASGHDELRAVIEHHAAAGVPEIMMSALPERSGAAAPLFTDVFRRAPGRNPRGRGDSGGRALARRGVRVALITVLIVLAGTGGTLRRVAHRRTMLQQLTARVADLQRDEGRRRQQQERIDALTSELAALAEQVAADPYTIMRLLVSLLGDGSRITRLTVTEARIEAGVTDPRPFSIVQRIRAAEQFTEVTISRVSAVSGENRFRFTISARYVP